MATTPAVESPVTSPLDPADILDIKELSKRLRVRPSCIHEWLRKRGTPDCLPVFKLGRHLRFSWREVSVWILSQRNKRGRGGRPPARKKSGGAA